MTIILKVGEIGRVLTGKTPKTSSSSFWDGDIPFYTPSDMDGRRRLDRVKRYITNEGLKSVKNSTIPPNSVMVSCIGSDMGKVSLNLEHGVTNQQINTVVPDPEIVDYHYLYYSFLPRKAELQMLASGGSAQPILNKGQFSQIELSIPPLKEQRAIAHILGTLDDKIELNQKMNQTLEDIAKAIFKSWFVDFDPVRAKVEGRSTGLPDEISDLFPDALEESEIGEIPAGWKVSPLDSIGTFKNGLALQKYPPLEGLERLPVVKIAQLRKGSTIGDDTYASGVPDGFVIDDGDFVFSWSGTLMAKYWVGGRGALNQHLFKVEGQTQPLWMVAGWVEHFMPEFQSIAASKATTMGHIQREHLRQALCIIPPADVVDVCSAIITPIIERCVLAQQESKVLSELRDTLLPKLISGELRIPDAEKFLEEAGI